VAFRRTFAEVCRTRSLLFVGTSLSDPYFLGLFDEGQELLGPAPHCHYAFMVRGTVDASFLERRLGIRAVEFDSFDEITRRVADLGQAFDCRTRSGPAWTFMTPAPTPTSLPSQICVHLGSAPTALPDGHCLALGSGHRNGRARLSRSVKSTLKQIGRQPYSSQVDSLPAVVPTSTIPTRTPTISPVFLVVARGSDGPGYRDARILAKAMELTLDAVLETGASILHATVWAAGRHRHSPVYVSLLQMLRGYLQWTRVHASERIALHIHVADPATRILLTGGRVNVLEWLSSTDIRFWLEIWMTESQVQRYLVHYQAGTTLRRVLTEHDVYVGWAVAVLPKPHDGFVAQQASDIPIALTLEAFGVFQGSTLRVGPPEFLISLSG
jgi:hypothetical protein